MTEKAQKPCNGKKCAAKRVFHVAAAAALIVLVLGLTACAVIPQVRESIANFLRSFGSHSVVSVDTDDGELNPTADMEAYELAGYTFCIPKEYELDAKTTDACRSVCNFIDGDCSIVIYVSQSGHSPIQLDTEDTETKTIIINGKEGFVIEKGNQKHITWGDSENNTIICVFGENVPEKELLDIAETFILLKN